MADLINSWLPYQELSLEKDRDPVLDDGLNELVAVVLTGPDTV